MRLVLQVLCAMALLVVLGSPLPLSAQESSPNSSPTPATLWQRYLQPQAEWPALPASASDDVRTLPEPPTGLDSELVALGKKLFNDPRLSADSTVSCASCHMADNAFAEPRRTSLGVAGKTGKRNAPSLRNVHLWQTLFWDGRSDSLEQQARMPVEDPLEMAHSVTEIADMVAHSPDYQPLLQSLGWQQPQWSSLAQALAEFQRTLADAPTAPLDRFIRSVNAGHYRQAKQALTDQQLRGLHLYRTKAGCVKCHNGALLSDQEFHGTGLHYYGRKYEDLGRYEVTGIDEDMGRFRTPTLRHLMASRPWMHNGLFNSLKGVVRLYEHGGARPRRPKDLPESEHYPVTTDLLVPFELSDQERQALLEFLKVL